MKAQQKAQKNAAKQAQQFGQVQGMQAQQGFNPMAGAYGAPAAQSPYGANNQVNALASKYGVPMFMLI